MTLEPSCRAELIERTALRRVWRISGPFESTIEWSLDHQGWRRYLGVERVLVDGILVWRELVFILSVTSGADFVIYAVDGPVPFSIEHYISAGRVVALRLRTEGNALYWEGDLSELPPGAVGLPIPAAGTVGSAADLPLPGEPSDAPISTPRRAWLTRSRMIGITCLTVVALLVGGIVAFYLDFRRTYGDLNLVGAASSGDAARVRKLLEHGSPANSYHIEGSSALWWAVFSGNLECVQLLLDHGADPNGRGQWDTVIEQSVQNLNLNDGKPRAAIVKALLARGSQIKDPAQLELLKEAVNRKHQVVPAR